MKHIVSKCETCEGTGQVTSIEDRVDFEGHYTIEHSSECRECDGAGDVEQSTPQRGASIEVSKVGSLLNIYAAMGWV